MVYGRRRDSPKLRHLEEDGSAGLLDDRGGTNSEGAGVEAFCKVNLWQWRCHVIAGWTVVPYGACFLLLLLLLLLFCLWCRCDAGRGAGKTARLRTHLW